MGIFSKKQNISKGNEKSSALDKKQPFPREGFSEKKTPKVFPKDTSIFGGKPYLRRSEFRRKLREASPFVPGTSKIIPRSERAKMEKDLFGKSYGSLIDKREFSKAIGKLEKQKYQSRKSVEKMNLDRKIRYLKKLGGIEK